LSNAADEEVACDMTIVEAEQVTDKEIEMVVVVEEAVVADGMQAVAGHKAERTLTESIALIPHVILVLLNGSELDKQVVDLLIGNGSVSMDADVEVEEIMVGDTKLVDEDG
jgi:hypothetical protein